jgi:RNAse (barnase) inhibitor barstar
MRMIELDATKWKTIVDFYDALLAAIGAPKDHGKSPDALIDSMIWGGMNAVEPPYTIRILGAATLPTKVRNHLEVAKEAIAKGRADYRNRRNGDVEIAVEIES